MEPVSNHDIADIITETARLMEVHGMNEFKIKSMQNAAFNIGRMEMPLYKFSKQELEQIKGIGKSISEKVIEIVSTGTLPELNALLKDTPSGVVEMMQIKGIGPKKAATVWKDLGVETPGELLYACNENRLIELKGFGSKTQEQIKKAIEFAMGSKGFFHYAALEAPATAMIELLRKTGWFSEVSLTGAIRRKSEVLQNVSILAACDSQEQVIEKIKSSPLFVNFQFEEIAGTLMMSSPDGIVFCLQLTSQDTFPLQLFLSTASDSHLLQLKELKAFDQLNSSQITNESDLYKILGLSFVEPELREGFNEIELASKNQLPTLIEFQDLKGSLHNHSTYSDGVHTLREMAMACRDAGYEYLGICDHSKSAFYANGLNEERIAIQHLEIDALNIEMAPFRIFKGIESDILHDGSLDYPLPVLQKFDFIVASVHSGLKMTKEKATERLLKAIANPNTTILGHPTGRLLLAREGYPIDHKAVIDECARHQVVIELNAHPYRLDLDWRWIQYALSQNVRISINPDAHHVSGFHDMYFGVCVARKGMLTKPMTFNTLSVSEIEQWFLNRKKVQTTETLG